MKYTVTTKAGRKWLIHAPSLEQARTKAEFLALDMARPSPVEKVEEGDTRSPRPKPAWSKR